MQGSQARLRKLEDFLSWLLKQKWLPKHVKDSASAYGGPFIPSEPLSSDSVSQAAKVIPSLEGAEESMQFVHYDIPTKSFKTCPQQPPDDLTRFLQQVLTTKAEWPSGEDVIKALFSDPEPVTENSQTLSDTWLPSRNDFDIFQTLSHHGRNSLTSSKGTDFHTLCARFRQTLFLCSCHVAVKAQFDRDKIYHLMAEVLNMEGYSPTTFEKYCRGGQLMVRIVTLLERVSGWEDRSCRAFFHCQYHRSLGVEVSFSVRSENPCDLR